MYVYIYACMYIYIYACMYIYTRVCYVYSVNNNAGIWGDTGRDSAI